MDIVLTDIDALYAHRLARRSDAPFKLVKAHETPTSALFGKRKDFDSSVLSALEQLGLTSRGYPIHVRVFNDHHRPRFKKVAPHVCSVRLSRGSFWKVVPTSIELSHEMEEQGIRVFVDCPALCVISRAAACQRSESGKNATITRFAKTLALASELAGRFSLDPDDPANGATLYDIEPVMTREELLTYVANASGIDGLGLARSVAGCLANQQGSIMEVALYACLTLRPALGGLHLARPITNEPLPLGDRIRPLLKHKTIRPDFYWMGYGLVLEYDGEPHFTDEGIREDKRRLNDYQVLGLTVFPVFDEDMREDKARDALLRRIVRHMAKTDGPSLRRRTNLIFANKAYANRRAVLIDGIRTVS